MQYSVYEFFTKDEIERDWLISLLTDHHFEGFEETADSLKGFVAKPRIREILIKELLHDNDFTHIRFTAKDIEDKNWNEEWEKNFEPVIIGNRVSIRAPFHQAMHADFELVIEPKMSFGTGHHATTAAMIELMLDADLSGKSVLDFGSGTGVLAILAEKLGAKKIVAIDHEEWAFKNCIENVELNECSKIECLHGNDKYEFAEQYDVILANINRNVIVDNLAHWKKLMKPGADIIVSGILQSDEQIIMNTSRICALTRTSIVKKDGWLAIAFKNL